MTGKQLIERLQTLTEAELNRPVGYNTFEYGFHEIIVVKVQKELNNNFDEIEAIVLDYYGE